MLIKDRYEELALARETFEKVYVGPIITEREMSDKFSNDISAKDKIIFEGYPLGIFAEDRFNIENVEDIDMEKAFEYINAINDEKDLLDRKKNWEKQRAERGFSDKDVWDISYWFLTVMPEMLTQFRDNMTGVPASISVKALNRSVKHRDKEDDINKAKWEEIIDRMIFLLKEMDEETCSMKNVYEKEVVAAEKEFESKYGMFGCNFEKLNNIKHDDSSPGKRIYFYHDDPDHPEWKVLSAKSMYQDLMISNYRDKCREEFFNLFSQWFWDLWD